MTQFIPSTNTTFNDFNVDQLSAPTFADVDGDGDLDLLVGANDGRLGYVLDNGTTSPNYEAQIGTNNPFNDINVENLSTPTFADVDGDGNLDLVVGGRPRGAQRSLGPSPAEA